MRSVVRSLVLVGSLTSVFTTTTGEAVVLRHDRELERTVELGARFPFVGAAGGGSGALIGERWVLTAAHVVEAFGPFDFWVRFGDREYAVARTFVHPGEEETPWDRRTNDIALLFLAQPVVGVEPVALLRSAGELGEMQELGKTAVIAGVGFFGTAGKEPVSHDGRRRAVTNKVVDLERAWLKVVFSRPPGGTELEGMGGPGDSGGPLLIEAQSGVLLAGVGSYAEYIDAEAGKSSGYGALDFFVRVVSYVPWIDEVTSAVEGEGSVPFEGPAPPRKVDGAEAGLPDTPVGTRAMAYFDAFDSGDADTFREFLVRNRTAESLAERPMEEHLDGYNRLYGQLGRLRLERYTATSRDEISVLVTSDAGEIVFDFRVQALQPHALETISIYFRPGR